MLGLESDEIREKFVEPIQEQRRPQQRINGGQQRQVQMNGTEEGETLVE